jgi:hypothetical protein
MLRRLRREATKRDELIAKEKAKDATGALSGPSEGGVAARRRRRVAE